MTTGADRQAPATARDKDFLYKSTWLEPGAGLAERNICGKLAAAFMAVIAIACADTGLGSHRKPTRNLSTPTWGSPPNSTESHVR